MKNISTRKERILLFIDYKGISKNKFYIETGVSNGTLDKKSGLSMETIEKIYSTYPEISLEWLITGNGEMIEEVQKVDSNEVKIIKKARTVNSNTHYKKVPFYDVDFIAGDLESINDQTIVPAYYMDIPEFSGCTAFRAYNDSMEPLIKSGMILFASEELDWLDHIEYGQIYGVVTNSGNKYLKYIRKFRENSKDYFLLMSENKECYDEFEIKKKSIKSIWLIHGWINQRVSKSTTTHVVLR